MKFLALASTLLVAGQLAAAAPNPTKRDNSDGLETMADVLSYVFEKSGAKCVPDKGITLDEVMNREGKQKRRNVLTERQENGGGEGGGGTKHSDPKPNNTPDPKNDGGKNEGGKNGGGKNDGGKGKLKNLCSMTVDDDCPELGKAYWDESWAGDYGDIYINKYSAKGWVRGLDDDIFRENSLLNCEELDSTCDNMRPCSKYSFLASFSTNAVQGRIPLG